MNDEPWVCPKCNTSHRGCAAFDAHVETCFRKPQAEITPQEMIPDWYRKYLSEHEAE